MSTLQEVVDGLSPRARRVYWAFAYKAASGVPIITVEAATHWWATYKRDIIWKFITASFSGEEPLLDKLREWGPPGQGGVLYYPLVIVHFWDAANENEKEAAKCVLRLLNIPLSILDEEGVEAVELEPDPLARFRYI